MIVQNPKMRNAKTALRHSALGPVFKPWLYYLSFSVGVTVLSELSRLPEFTLSTAPFTFVGLALSIFLGFRNNACYDRWWEARRLWGGIVNTTRTLTRQALTVVAAPPHEEAEAAAWRKALVRTTIGWTYATKHHLRGESPTILPWLEAAAAERVVSARNVPSHLLRELGGSLLFARRRGWLDPLHLPAMDATLTELTNLLGGCERIKNTPVPYAYTALTHRIIGTYCLAMPFGLVDTVGKLTPIVVALVAFAFLSLDAVGSEVEDPFGADPNDLPLNALCRVVEIDLLQAIGEPDLPSPLAAVDDVLS